jgi:dihydroorotase
MRELDAAPFGMINLETTLALVITKLIAPGHLDWSTALSKLTINPAKALGLDKGTLRIGADADITVIDPEHRWIVDPTRFRSKSQNTPLAGVELQGKAAHVMVGGELKF